MSYTPPNPRPYQSSVWSDVAAAGLPRPKYLLSPSAPNLLAAYAWDQNFSMASASYTTSSPIAKNTRANGFSTDLTDTNAILTGYTTPQDMGGGLLGFTASFARVPASWDEFVTQVVTFPGIRDSNYQGGVRDPKQLNVLTRQRRDYYVIDPTGVLSGITILDSDGTAAKVVASKGAIPTLYRQPWKFLVSGSALATSEVTGLVKAGGITGWLETLPNTGTYQQWIANAASFNAALIAGGTTAWDATHPPLWDGTTNDTTVGQYRFSDSRLEEYVGNIIALVSEYVLAQ